MVKKSETTKEKLSLKRRSTTHSDLAKKYPADIVAHARDMVRAETGKKRLNTQEEWAYVGELAKLATKHRKKLSLYKVDRVAKRTKKEGVEPAYQKFTRKR